MSGLPCRGSIARAAVVVALLSSRAADAQVVVVPSPKQPIGLANPLFTGVAYDVWNQKKAEQLLEHLQAKSRRDAERGDSAAVGRDARWINNVRQRIVVDEWLIRMNTLQDPGCYPLRIDCESNAAIAEVARPAPDPDPFRPAQTPGPTAAPTIPITIVNAGPAGGIVTFTINDIAHQVAGGSRQDLVVAPDSIIGFDGGGSLGRRRYRIAPGLYEFRSTAEGWALYKLPDVP